MNVFEYNQEVKNYFDGETSDIFYLMDEFDPINGKQETVIYGSSEQFVKVSSGSLGQYDTKSYTYSSKPTIDSHEVTMSESKPYSSSLKENPKIFEIEKMATDEQSLTRDSKNEKNNKPEEERRKYQKDGMRKKVKVILFEYILQKLNIALLRIFPDERRNFIKLSKGLMGEIKIEYNKVLNEMRLGEIFREDRNVYIRRGINDPCHNQKLADFVSERSQEMNDLLNKTVNEMFVEFLNSDEKVKHLEKIREKETDKYYEIYEKILHEYAFHYISKNPNKIKKN